MSEGPNKRPPSPWMKNLGLWVVILLGLAVVVNLMQGPSNARSGDAVAYSDFLARVDDGAVKSVEIRGDEIIGRTSNDEEFRTFNPGDTQLIERLRTKGVRFDARPEESRSVLVQLFFNMLPFILMIGIWIFVMRQMQ
ncbi:MAG: ATP-dependent metallopeptidase FtsH/Yme1/Tma family protein, partial [Sandarakinorhabdus sp.]